MSASTPKRKGNVQIKSQSYPGTPQTEKLRVNLTEAFNNYDNDVTITTTAQDTVYETALEQNSSSPKETMTLNASIRSFERVNEFADEVEKLRDQLRTMLNPQEHFFEESPDLLNISSSSSIDTIALLKSALPHSSPELQLDDNGVLLSSSNSTKYTRNGMLYQAGATVVDSSLTAENMILKENIGKERYRRKHCEEIIHELQNKLLESQEQLAVAQATEKKKEIMIEQLDRTLANVVEGWKQQDLSKITLINQLQDEKETLEIQQQSHEKVLEKFEDDLSEAVKAAEIEQEKKLETESKLKELQEQYEEKTLSHTNEVNELKKANQFLKEENEQLVCVNSEITKEKDALMQEYQEEQTQWQLKHEELTEQIAISNHETKSTINELQSLVEAGHKQLEVAQASLSSKENSIKSLQMKLEATLIEKDRLSMEISLIQSKLEAVKTKKDSEMRAKLEEEFNSQIFEIQKQIGITEHELRQSQNKQMNEVNRKHHEEMELQRQRFQNDIKQKEEHFLQQVNELKDRLQHADNEMSELAGSNKILHQQRSELMNRMKSMMQQHWQETVSLLDTEKQSIRSSSVQPPDQLSSTFRTDFSTANTNPFLPDDVRINPIYAQQHMETKENTPYMHVSAAGRKGLNNMTSTSQSSYDRFVIDAHQNEVSLHNTSGNTYGMHAAEISDKPTSTLSTKLVDPRIRPPMYNSHGDSKVESYSRSVYAEQPNEVMFIESATNRQPPSQTNAPNQWLHKEERRYVPFEERVNLTQPGWNQDCSQVTTSDPDQRPNNFNEESVRSLDPFSYSSQTNEYEAKYVNAEHASHHHPKLNRSSESVPNHKQFGTDLHNRIIANSEFELRNTGSSHVIDPISFLYHDLESLNDETVETLDDKINMQEEKQGRLSHFIEKLLQRSPGQPLQETLQRSPGQPLEETLEKQDVISLNVDRLLENTTTTPTKQPISHTAFKKSVVRQPNHSTNRRRNSAKQNMSSSSDQLSPEKKRQHLTAEQDQLMQLKILLDATEKIDDVSVLKLIQQMKKSKEQDLVASTTNHVTIEPHLMKSTISSEAKHHVSRRSVKSINVNKNVASKEQRRMQMKHSASGKHQSVWK